MQLDEKRIQEIVEKVMARLGNANLPSSPAEAVTRAADRPAYRYTPPVTAEIKRPSTLKIPAARLGIFPDVDSAAKAARKAFEEYDKTPIETRNRIIAAMRATTLKHLR